MFYPMQYSTVYYFLVNFFFHPQSFTHNPAFVEAYSISHCSLLNKGTYRMPDHEPEMSDGLSIVCTVQFWTL
jgi:hypothetical protein